MSFCFSVLASGSTGNSFYIEAEETKLLVDAGLSGKQVEKALNEIDRNPDDLSGILVSHEHTDHIKGVGVLARKYDLPIYANEKTWQAMESELGKLSTEQKFHFETDTVMTLGNIDIQSFAVSHDANDPMFFTFHYNHKKVGLVTDLGYVSERIKSITRGANALVFEANHDVNLLQMSRYPWRVKRRILSDVGHVSNEDCGLALSEIITDQTRRVYLAHLSQDNNMKELAQMSVKQVLNERDMTVDLYDTDPYKPTPLYHVI